MEDGAPEDPRELRLYRLAEAAHYLRVPVSTLRGWISGFDYHVRSGTRRAAPLIRPPARPGLHEDVPVRDVDDPGR